MIADNARPQGESPLPDVDVVALAAFDDNYIWRIGATDRPGRPMVVVDPGEAEPVLADLQSRDNPLVAILITHHHGDHVGGVGALKKHWPQARVIGPASCATRGAEEIADHGQRIVIPELGLIADVIATPGHTADHLSYFCDTLPGHEAPLLFCGDTLFAAGCGRVFDGTIEQHFRSLTTLAMLPMDTRVHCAHEFTLTNLYFAQQAEPNNPRIRQRLEECLPMREEGQPTLPSTIAQELSTNPFLRTHLPALGAHLPTALQPATPNPLSVFQALRTWRNEFRAPS
ncbi:MAG: hydroxyacylglutathione hydrolase [Lautropia sp.]|nr:hydroxyacylglutathione hydrolase [Lautropia sp.]